VTRSSHERRYSPGRALAASLPLLAAAALLLIGLWLRLPTIYYDGPATQEAFNDYAFDRFAYSDVASLWFRDGLADQPRPYFDYQFEYPVGIGLFVYAVNAVSSNLSDYFLLTSMILGAATLAALWLVDLFPRGNVFLFALSPALALYVNLNWDAWGVLLMVAALLLFVRGRDGWGSVALAAAVWTKFFPVVFVPLLLADRLRHEGWRAAGRVAAVFAAASAAINLPVLLARPAAWWHFFGYNRTRDAELNVYTLSDAWDLTVPVVNALSAGLLAVGTAVLLVLIWRSPAGVWLPACCALLAWFFFVGKVYSPQYGLWVVVLLAVVGSAPALAVAWSAVDLAYFAASFLTLGLLQFGDAAGWFVEHGLEPVAVLREGMLLVVVGWCVKVVLTEGGGQRYLGLPR
jgi:hypothetical protein